MLTDYATAAEALAQLKVRPQILYAYVSRGWIRSVAQKGLKEKLTLPLDCVSHNRYHELACMG